MQHLNMIDENQTIYESLAVINNNFQTLLSCYSGATQPVSDPNTTIPAGMLWYNTAENRVYQLDYNTPANWVLVSDLSGTGTTKEYVDGRITGHNHDSTYLKLDAPAKDVQFVNGTAADQVIFKSNISDTQGTSSATVAPSSRLFEQTRQQVRTFIDTLGDPDAILKQLQDILKLIEDNQGNLDNLGIDNIQGLRSALDGKMPLATTLEDLGGVRADGASPNGFTGRVLFKSTSAIANGGALIVGRDGTASTLQAVRIWDDGGTNPDAVQIGDNTARTFINALSPNDAYIAVGGTTRHTIYNKGNIANLDTDLGTRGFMKEADADAKYLLATGKAADSSLLNGVAESAAQSNNTIVKRNSAGDIVTRYFRTNAGAGAGSDVNYFLVQRATGTGGDNYARPVSLNNVKGALGISKLPNWSSGDFDSRYVNKTGDSVSGDFSVSGTFFANNFCVKDLPEMQMGNGGVNDEYLVICRRFTGTNIDATGVSGHFKFHRGSVTDSHVNADTYLVLSVENNNDYLGIFDEYGTSIFDSINAITIGGVAYYAAKIRGTGGGNNATFWQFEGSVVNHLNDNKILTRVRASDSNVTIGAVKWTPSRPINSFNFVSEGSKNFLRLDGRDMMTGDLKMGANHILINGHTGIQRAGGNRVLWDHNNGNVTLSAGSSSGHVYLGYNSGAEYQTNHVRLESDLYTKDNTLMTIDTSTGQLFDVGQRVYSPNNNSAIGVLNRANAWSNVNTFDFSDYTDGTGFVVNYGSGTGGWARHVRFDNTASSNPYFRIGLLGSSTTYTHAHLGFGDYGDAKNLRIYPDGNVTVGSNKVWHAGNDGGGSGLDADKLDGLQASQFLRSDADVSFGGRVKLKSPKTYGNASVASLTTAPIYTDFQNVGGTSMFLPVFHTASQHSSGYRTHLNVGLYKAASDWGEGATGMYVALGGNDGHPTENFTLTYGGDIKHSKGYRFWHTGNDGSGSGLDADTVDGIQGASFLRADADDNISGSLLWSGDQDFDGLYWGARFKDANGHSGNWAYIRQSVSAGNLEIGSDDQVYIYETDSRALAIAISTNNKTLDAKGGLLEGGTKLVDKYLGKTAKAADADKLDGQDSVYYRSGSAYETIDINVGGDANKYYPVRISTDSVNGYAFEEYHIARGYNWTAPDSWHNSTHKGGLSLAFQWSGDSAWGGNDHNLRVVEFHEQYSNMVSGLELSTGGIIVWLRGGGGLYRITSPHGKRSTVTVHLSGYTDQRPTTYSPISYDSNRVNSLRQKHNLRYSGQVFDEGNRVYRENNHVQLGTDKVIYFDGATTYAMRESNGSYGTISVHGKKSGWAGYSIADRVCFMHDGGNASGLYDDVNNKWLFLAYNGGESRMYYAGSEKIATTSTGVRVTGTITGALSGNASTATWADTCDVNTSTSTGWYPLVWHSGDTLFSSYRSGNADIKIRPSDGYVDFINGQIRLRDNKYLFLGTGSDVEFFCNGSHMYTDLNSGIGNWYIRDGSTTRFTFDDAGHFTATGNITAYSDIRLKENLEVIPDALDKVCKLTGYTYDKANQLDKDAEGYEVTRETGVIAQQVQEVLPEAIKFDEDDPDKILSVAHGNMIGLLIEAIKELKAEVEELKANR